MPSEIETITAQRIEDNRRAMKQTALNLILISIATYGANVAMNAAFLLRDNGPSSLSSEAALRQVFYADEETWNHNTIFLVLGIITILVVFFIAQYRLNVKGLREQAQFEEISRKIDALTPEIAKLDGLINAYVDKYKRLTPQWVSSLAARLRRKEVAPRPQPTEEERKRYDANYEQRKRLKKSLSALKEKQHATSKSETGTHYSQIVRWLEDDKDLLNLTANYIRQRTQFSAAGRTAALLILTTAASRLLVRLFG